MGTEVVRFPPLLLVEEASPQQLDLQQRVTLDYFLIHFGDVDGGPESMHPPVVISRAERRPVASAGSAPHTPARSTASERVDPRWWLAARTSLVVATRVRSPNTQDRAPRSLSWVAAYGRG